MRCHWAILLLGASAEQQEAACEKGDTVIAPMPSSDPPRRVGIERWMTLSWSQFVESFPQSHICAARLSTGAQSLAHGLKCPSTATQDGNLFCNEESPSCRHSLEL